MSKPRKNLLNTIRRAAAITVDAECGNGGKDLRVGSDEVV